MNEASTAVKTISKIEPETKPQNMLRTTSSFLFDAET
ncbi:Uncharacterised protein [Acinetobacter baumannii]|nr:Uncharacterised protein [Acinetobacter baumannii]SSU19916.1 Uncharacterised protein [Acinetobacter baumannii]SVK01973.1 Uncharacterised protein [Acinetobacter baumannii]